MATTTDEKLIFVKQLAGEEDLVFGLGQVAQVREGETVAISMINAASIPFDSTRSVKDVLVELLNELGA